MQSRLRRFASLYSGHRWRIAVFFGLAILQFLAAAPLPFVVREVFDTAIADGRTTLLVVLSAVMVGLQLSSLAIGLISANWLLRISTQMIQTLRQAVFDKLFALSIQFHDNQPLGDLHDRVVHETERVGSMTRNGYAVALPASIFTFGILGVLVFINWILFLVTLAFVPVVFAINRFTRGALHRGSRRLHASVESLSEMTFRTLRTMRQTRILGAEPQAREQQDEMLTEAAKAVHYNGLIQRSHLAANRMVIAIWVALVLTVGGAAVIDGRLTLGELFSFYAGLALIREPIDQLIRSMPMIVAGHEALSRVFELLDTEAPRPYAGSQQLDIEARLSMDRVTFEYEEGSPVLMDVSLSVEPGEVVALAGPNGSGKTTLASLILGFYRPTSGRISVDGVDYRDLDIRYLRRQYGVVTQDPIMIPGTVRQNVTYGRSGVTEPEFRRAVELAGILSFINQLEEGFETRAYENGPLLSGGQLQRIALARALLGHPALLILDEPTTHLDLEGVGTLLGNLRSLADAPAMVLITHKQEVAAMADSLYQMENGRLAQVDETKLDSSSGM